MADKFAQLKQFWQKGKKATEEESSPARRSADAPLQRRGTVTAAAPAPTPSSSSTTAAAAPSPAVAPFDPYGTPDDLSFVPEEKQTTTTTKSEANPAAFASPYTLDEHFEAEEAEEEEVKPVQAKREQPASSSTAVDSLYTATESFNPEEEEVKEVVVKEESEPQTRAEEQGAAPYSTVDDLYATPDFEEEFPQKKEDKLVPQSASKGQAAPTASFNRSSYDIYSVASGDVHFHKDGEGAYERVNYNYASTPYEGFQLDSSSAGYYSGVVDQLIEEDKEVIESLYGAEEEVADIYGAAESEMADTSEDKKLYGGSDDDDDDDADSDWEEDDKERPKRHHQAKDWNSQFQNLLDMPASAEKFSKLARLAHDFVFAAETYGKIIISELGLENDKKTIKPTQAGGQAGGEKFVVQGIFFKFALDIFGIYGDDEYAMKAASHDLKGLIHYYSCQIPGLHVPLMALIDYLGFRLIAITILPINGKTIKYGSCDAGQTVHADDPHLNEMMEEAGRKMNLQGHYVGVPNGVARQLYAPVDIEGHQGTDGRYYVVDFARTFPPERPSPTNLKRKGIILYNLLRPELVKCNGVPLSPDAFTLWAKADEKKDLYNTNVTEATRRLLKEVIPEVAKRLNEMTLSATHVDLVEVLHGAGVNMRHLGYIRRLANEDLQEQILIEMIVRVVRKQLQEKFRKKTRFAGIPTEEPHKLAAVKYLNKLLGRHPQSTQFWHLLKRALLYKFAKCLLDHEMEPSYDLRKNLSVKKLFTRLQKLAPNTFILTEQANLDFENALKEHQSQSWHETPPDFKFLPSDLMPLAATIKHMNLIDIAEASSMFYGSLEEKGNDQVRLLIQGLGKFQIAARKMPFISSDTVITLGEMLVQRAKDCSTDRHRQPEMESAISGATIAFQTALNINSKNARCLLGLGDINVVKNAHHAAREKYREAIVAQPDFAEAYVKLATTWGHGFMEREPDEKGEMREEALRKALELNPEHATALVLLGDLYLDRAFDASSKDKEAFPKLLEEAAERYSRALSLTPNDHEAFSKIKGILQHLHKAGNRFYNKTVCLETARYFCQFSPLLNDLCRAELAKLKELHLEDYAVEDEDFKAASGASSLTHVYFRIPPSATPLPSATALREWLQSHPTPLQELSCDNFSQLDDAFMHALAGSVHRTSLTSLEITNASAITVDALREFFLPASEAEDPAAAAQRWPSLTALNLSRVPAVVHEVLAALAAACPALTSLEVGQAEMTDKALEMLPSQLTQLHLSGPLSNDALQSAFTQRLTALSRVSLQGVTTISFDESYALATALPALKWFQFTCGEVNHWSGNDRVTITYNDRPPTSFSWNEGTAQKPQQVTYTISQSPPFTMLTTDKTRVKINSINPSMRTVAQGSYQLFNCRFMAASGWLFDRGSSPLLAGTLKALKFIPQSRQCLITPSTSASVHQQAFSNNATVTISPHQNITLIVAAVYLGLTQK